MIISGKKILQLQCVRNYLGKSQFQPAGVDLSVQQVWEFDEAGLIDFENIKRKIPKCRALDFGPSQILHLPPGAYKIMFNEIISIPPNFAAIAQSRSSLLRMGASVQTAIWDPGYEGRSEALLLVHNPHGIDLQKNARVAQLVFFRIKEPSGETYNGAYQRENLNSKQG
jgi:dUTP pyrophosphatase